MIKSVGEGSQITVSSIILASLSCLVCPLDMPLLFQSVSSTRSSIMTENQFLPRIPVSPVDVDLLALNVCFVSVKSNQDAKQSVGKESVARNINAVRVIAFMTNCFNHFVIHRLRTQWQVFRRRRPHSKRREPLLLVLLSG